MALHNGGEKTDECPQQSNSAFNRLSQLGSGRGQKGFTITEMTISAMSNVGTSFIIR